MCVPSSMRRQDLARLLVLGTAAFFSIATPAPLVTYPRAYPAWEVESGAFWIEACAEVRVWVSKSGKEGLGVSVEAQALQPQSPTRDAPRPPLPSPELAGGAPPPLRCQIGIHAARLRVGGLALDPVAVTPPVSIAASTLFSLPSPADPTTGTPPADPTAGTPPADAHDPRPPANVVYAGFRFDNEAQWNAGRDRATLELQLLVNGRPSAVRTIPLVHARAAAHRRVGRGERER